MAAATRMAGIAVPTLAFDPRIAPAALRAELAQLEEQERADLQLALADPKLYEGEDGDPAAIQKKLGRVGKNLESAEEEWAAAQEEFDRDAESVGGA